MTTLPVGAPAPSATAGLERVIFFVAAFFEVIAEAQRAAAAAHERYPFADW
jgi:hypothetical protein